MGHQPGSVAVIHRVWTLWKNEALLKGHNLLYIIAALLALMFASTTFFFWYHEMFRDGFIGEFSRAFDSGRGKNFVALAQPAFGALSICSSIIFISEAITSDPSHQIARTNSPWYLWKLLLATICLLLLLVLVLSIIPFTLPEWMYPEYHAAKREEQRKQEAAEHGEAEDRNPFLGDDGVYASQLGNVPINIPEAVGLPSTAAPHSLQTVPSPGSPLPPHGAPEAGAPALYGPDATPAPHAGTADAFDITAAIASLPRTGTPTSHGARPARASRAHRGNGSPATTPTGTREDPNGDA